MSKFKRPMDNNTNKKMQKEIRFSQSLLQPSEAPAKETIKELRKTHKLSKRTAPGLHQETAPRHPHIEGERWTKTVTKQSVLNGRSLSRHMNKNK